MVVLPYLEDAPRIGPGVVADRWSAVIGRTQIGANCCLGPLATLRADGEDIRVGSDCWFGEASTVHIADGMYATHIGSHVTLGRYGLIHACTVGDDCVVGEHAVVMDGAVVGPAAVIAAESVVPPGKQFDGGWIYAGTPAKPVEPIARARVEELHRAIRGSTQASADAQIVRAKNPVGSLRHPPGSGIGAFEAAYIAPTASIRGHLKLARHSSIWFAVEIDAEGAMVELGEASNIQDNSRVYLRPGERVLIGRRVTVGHNVRMRACEIEDEALIGMGSIIGERTVVRAGAVVAAGSITAPGTEVAAGYIWSGQPARRSKPLSPENRALFSLGVDVYIRYAERYLHGKRAG
jgi:carbonic anhydrase/acetyltransferase-like protein (isoleucine patch superfamily)